MQLRKYTPAHNHCQHQDNMGGKEAGIAQSLPKNDRNAARTEWGTENSESLVELDALSTHSEFSVPHSPFCIAPVPGTGLTLDKSPYSARIRGRFCGPDRGSPVGLTGRTLSK